MSTSLELVIKAKSEYAQAFTGLQQQLDKTSEHAKRHGYQLDSVTDRAARFSDGVGRMSTTLARSADSMNLPVGPLRALDDVMDVAELGFNNLSKSAAGFNLASVGVIGAGLAIGMAIGGLLNKFKAVRDAADALTGAIYRLFQSQAELDKQANATTGLKKFQVEMEKKHEEAVRKQIESFRAAGKTTEEIAKIYKGQLSPAIMEHLGLTEKQIKASHDAESAAEKHKKALKEYRLSLLEIAHDVERELIPQMQRLGFVLPELKPPERAVGALGSIADASQRAYESASKLAEKFARDLVKGGVATDEVMGQIRHKLEGMGLDAVQVDTIISHLPATIGDAEKKTQSWGKTLKADILGALKDLPGVILGAIQGGGDVGQAIGAHLGGSIGDSLSKSLTPVLTRKLGETLGGALGGVLPGLGSILGAGVGKLFDKVFKKEEMQVNDLRDSFISAHGGWLALQKDIAKATSQDLLKKLFDAKTVDQYNAALKEVQDTLATHDEAQQKLNAAIEKYGFTIDELGPKFAQQKLDEQAASLFEEYQLLSKAGVDHNAILARMGPAFTEYVQSVIKGGGTIPEAMRPAIEALIRNDDLLDENGNAYTSVEEAGISFAKTQAEMFDTLIEKIDKMVSALLGIPSNVKTTVTTDYVSTGGGPPQGGPPNPTDYYARGGIHGATILPFVPRAARGMVHQPTPGGQMYVAGEGGKTELTAPVRDLAREIGAAAAQAAGGESVVNVYIGNEKIDAIVERRTRQGFMRPDSAGIRKRG